jgi:hypothetical protein
MMAKGGINPRNLCMDKPPLTEEQWQELVKIRINKMVFQGVYTPPPGSEVDQRLEEAANRNP